MNLTTADQQVINNSLIRIPFRRICGTTTNEPLRWQSTGGTYLAAQWPSDHLLFRLNDILPLSIKYLGWDRTNTPNSTSIYSLHHPSGSPYNYFQHYSNGYISGSTINGNKYKVRWTVGETTTGSSGGPLIRASDNKVIGGVSLDGTIISIGTADTYFFKLSNAWNTNTGGLNSFLSPIQNLTTINAHDPVLMTGPTILCFNQTATINMPNLLPAENVTWTVTGGVAIVSSTGKSVNIIANNSGFQGNVTVTAAFIAPTQPNANFVPFNVSFTFWVGKPIFSVTNTTINSMSTGNSISLSLSNQNNLKINNLSQITSATWSFPTSWNVSNTSGFNTSIYSWSGSGPMSVTSTNTCGISSSTFFVNTVATIPPATVFPNIATEELNFSFSKNEINQFVIPNQIQIVDVVSTQILFEKKFSIEEKKNMYSTGFYSIKLNNIKTGLHILNAYFDNRVESNKIIIEK